MLRNRVISYFKKQVDYELTPDQDNTVCALTDFVLNNQQDEVFIFKGYAGTGKTTIISALVQVLKSLKIRPVLMAPTGRAAKVLSSYAHMPAFTIHKQIYRQKTAKDGFGEFVVDKNLYSNTIFIVDEASMISNERSDNSYFGSGRVLDDLMLYVFNHKKCKLLLVGDVAQLPPVGLEISPALDRDEVKAYLHPVKNIEIRQVVRQAEDSGILNNATTIRKNVEEQKAQIPEFYVSRFKDIEQISGENLVDTISDSYDKYGMDNTVIISRSNKRTNKYNEGIRRQILWHEEEITRGDYLMIVKNNYFWNQQMDNKLDFIANGDIVTIERINKYEELYGFRFADVDLKFMDYDQNEINAKIFLDTLMMESASMPYDANRKLYESVGEDFPDIKNARKRFEKIRENPHFNALQVKFSYAITCHKAQGGQWNSVFIDQGFLNNDMVTLEYLRWLYTAFTRATEKLYLVNFSDKFFTFH